jgi:hypothetical protein
MQRTVLFDLIRTFSKKEMKEFEDFVNSPFFNKNEKVIKLFNVIKKAYPDFDHPSLEKEKVYGKIFHGEEYNDSRMRQLVFAMCNLAEEFASYTYNKSTNEYKLGLLSTLMTRGVNRAFEKNLKEVSQNLENLSHDEEYYYSRYMLEYKNLAFQVRNYADSNEKVINKSDIQNLINHLTYSYLIKIMKFYIYLFNVKSRFSLEYDMKMLDELVIHLERSKYEKVPLVSIYYNVLMLHVKPDELEYFERAKELIFKHEGELDRINVVNVYINLENYCLKKSRSGLKRFRAELLELYKKELANKIYPLADGTMSPIFYRNVVRMALGHTEIEWIENFIEEYKHEVNKNAREGAYTLAMSMVEYKKKNYGKALEYLAKSQSDNLLYKLEIKALTLQIYYDAGEFESLSLLVDSFRHFLANNKLLSESRRDMNAKFIKYVNAIVKHNFSRDPAELAVLKRQITEEPIIENREWLIDKIEELVD